MRWSPERTIPPTCSRRGKTSAKLSSVDCKTPEMPLPPLGIRKNLGRWCDSRCQLWWYFPGFRRDVDAVDACCWSHAPWWRVGAVEARSWRYARQPGDATETEANREHSYAPQLRIVHPRSWCSQTLTCFLNSESTGGRIRNWVQRRQSTGNTKHREHREPPHVTSKLELMKYALGRTIYRWKHVPVHMGGALIFMPGTGVSYWLLHCTFSWNGSKVLWSSVTRKRVQIVCLIPCCTIQIKDYLPYAASQTAYKICLYANDQWRRPLPNKQ